MINQYADIFKVTHQGGSTRRGQRFVADRMYKSRIPPTSPRIHLFFYAKLRVQYFARKIRIESTVSSRSERFHRELL